MPEVAPRLTTTSFMASASNTQCAVAHHLRVHQAAVVFLVLAAQHGGQRGLVVVERDVGDEAQPALVDADQRHAVARQLAADAQHGAVAADHQAEIALLRRSPRTSSAA